MNLPKYPNIEAERAKLGITQDEPIKALGLKSRKTYYNWCACGKIPQKKLAAMADLFGCSIDYLLGHTNTTQK